MNNIINLMVVHYTYIGNVQHFTGAGSGWWARSFEYTQEASWCCSKTLIDGENKYRNLAL